MGGGKTDRIQISKGLMGKETHQCVRGKQFERQERGGLAKNNICSLAKPYLYIILCAFIFLTLPFPAFSQGKKEGETLREWRVGSSVSEESVRRYGAETFFSCAALPDSVFRLMQGRTYRKGCPLRRGDLRYLRLLHHDGKGKVRLGEMVCHRSIAQDVLQIFEKLYAAGYPVERVLLADRFGGDDVKSMEANNTSCFNYRPVAGSKKISKHGMGTAVDINPLYNPHVATRNGKVRVSPPKGKRYAERKSAFPYKIVRGDLCHSLFTAKGFKWGGAWRSSKDYQHFER